MNKLLSAEFVRLFKSLIFKLGLAVSVGFGIFAVLVRWLDIKKNAEIYAQLSIEYSNADGLIFAGGVYIEFVIAVFICIFVGTEYSDGTIRNKLTVGHTRGSIYLSKLIVCAAADIMMHILYILVVLAMGKVFLDGTAMEAAQILRFTVVSTTAVLALTALLLLFSMSIQNKAAGAVVCLLSVLIMMFATMSIQQRLEAPEYYDGYSYVDEETGKVITVEKEKNPKFLTGMKRDVYEFLNNVIPFSQLYQIAMNNDDNLGLIAAYDCAIIVITTGAGAAVFRRKNLK